MGDKGQDMQRNFMCCFGTGDFFEEWNEITPQIHIRKVDEQTT